MEGPAIPDRSAANSEALTIAAEGNRVRRVGLQFYGVSARLFGNLNQVNRLFEVLVVIRGKLGDDVYGLIRPDFPIANCEIDRRRHPALPTEQRVPKFMSS